MRGSELLLRKMSVEEVHADRSYTGRWCRRGPLPCSGSVQVFIAGGPTVVDQLNVLAELTAAAGEAKAKSLKVRISTAAKTNEKCLNRFRSQRSQRER
jgi:hypothetical protein